MLHHRGSGTPRTDTATLMERARNKTQGSSSFFPPPSSLNLGLNTKDGLSRSSPKHQLGCRKPRWDYPKPRRCTDVCTSCVNSARRHVHGIFWYMLSPEGQGAKTPAASPESQQTSSATLLPQTTVVRCVATRQWRGEEG